MSISINIHDPSFPAELYEIFFAKRLFTYYKQNNNFVFYNTKTPTWKQQQNTKLKNTNININNNNKQKILSLQIVTGFITDFWRQIASNTKIFCENYQK
uniref:Uncharacterized protein n=1 Tax=Meloidogyne enterolobii TaxID=390850 RepID=A0A6V7TP32_MELEN|nr:unnamed protein product [Meloidogyne enterolobii]